jgi:hypothetical protein
MIRSFSNYIPVDHVDTSRVTASFLSDIDGEDRDELLSIRESYF